MERAELHIQLKNWMCKDIMYEVTTEYKNYKIQIRKILTVLFKRMHPELTSTLVCESYLSSSMLLMDEYIDRTNIRDPSKSDILSYLLAVAIACMWIVDKFDDEDSYGAQILQKITGVHWKKIVRAERIVLTKLKYRIYQYMPGSHTLS